MNYNSNKNNRSESDVISWIITALCLWLWPPLGLVFLISKLSRKDFLKNKISRMLDRADEKKRRYGGFNASQWGGGWGSAPNQDSAADQNPAGKDAESRNGSAAPGWAPVWGEAPKRNGADRRGAGDFGTRKEAETVREAESKRESQRRKENDRRDGAYGSEQGGEAGGARRRDGSAGRVKSRLGPDVDRVSKGRGALIVFGWILFVLGMFQVFEPIFAFELWQIIQWGAVATGGGAMLIAAARKTRKEKDYEKYLKITGGRACVEIDKIASAAGSKKKEVLKELDDMVERGYFGKSAYIDVAAGLLIIDPEEAEAEFKAKATPPKASKAEAPRDKYDLLLSELRHACLRVENAGMKAKTEKIEALTEQIFAYIRETPEKEGSISSFINYYLPTTLKLINSYADFEAQEFQGQNIIKSRERIEAAADTIIKAYERQLDNLYLLDTIDVSSDISVLENMLKRDGLSGKSDFGASLPSN